MIQRYKMAPNQSMVTDPDGGWVEYTDHLAAIKEVIDDILGFIPEGWGMPLGWSEFINHLKEDSDDSAMEDTR